MKVVLLLLFATLNFYNAYCAMTEAQMKATFKLLRNVCQPKFKTTDEEITGMHNGDWNLKKSGKCYLWCILNSQKLITEDNVFNWELAVHSLNTQAPESVRTTAVESTKNCKDAVKTTTDKCEAGYEIAHCVYLDNPEKYFLP